MARTGAIIFRWGQSVRGREAQGLDVFGDALAYYEELAKEGRIIAHREYFSTVRDGGCMIIEGLLPELHQLMQEDDFLRLQMKASQIVEGFEAELCMGGSDQTVQEGVHLFLETMEELSLT